MKTISLTEYEAELITNMLKEERNSIDQARIYGDDGAATLARSSETLRSLISRFDQVFGPFVQR